jgi:N-acetylmuramoyl-L-alanine amidase
MITLLFYFFKVVLCSSLFFIYYWFFLRNKQFHQYNRFYLIGISLLSWIIPLIKIGVATKNEMSQTPVIQLASVVADNNTQFEQMVMEKSTAFDWNNFLVICFFVISILFLMRFVFSIFKIHQLLKKYSVQNHNGYQLVMTDVTGTPFSFFNYIFWNHAIDLNSEVGKKILTHELVHIKEKHSIDKIFIELQLIIAWCNPINWLIRNELYMIHEFIADEKSVEKKDASELAKLLLVSAYPHQQNLLTNPFFFSPIKRRLKMFTQSSTPKFSYVRRLSILPILCLLILLFAFRQSNPMTSSTVVNLKNQYTVVIDAGHGGDDSGAKGVYGTLEKEMTLLIAQKIKEINNNPNIKILLTRESDKTVSVKDRVNFANEIKADLFISIHMDMDLAGKSSGVKYIISKNTNPNYNESSVLATELQKSISSVFSKTNGLETRKHSTWVLEESQMPAVIFECGFISNAKDIENVKSKPGEIAEKILNGATAYLSRKESSDKVVFNKDNDPQFTCNLIEYDEKNKVMTLTDNVSFKNDKFEFADAGKVVYNEKTRKLIIYDCKNFMIDGKIIAKDNVSKVKTVEYTIGDDNVYLL